LIAKEPLLISSSSSPASAPNARVLETADSARRGPSFPTRAVSAVADAEEIWSAADDPSNSSDKTCKHTTHVNRGSCKGREHGHSAQHPRYSPYILHCAHAAQFLDDFQALTDTRDTAAASSNFSPRSATPCAMSALTRLAPSERTPKATNGSYCVGVCSLTPNSMDKCARTSNSVPYPPACFPLLPDVYSTRAREFIGSPRFSLSSNLEKGSRHSSKKEKDVNAAYGRSVIV